MSEIPNYEPNSHKYKKEKQQEQREKLKPVVTGVAKTKKKTGMQKFMDTFVQEDAQSIKTYILSDVLIPAAKKAINDIVTNGISMILYGDTAQKKKGSASKVSYRSYYDQPSRDPRDRRSDMGVLNYDEVVFDSRRDAEAVLMQMDELIDSYGFVTVADLYDISNISNAEYTTNKYGWTNLRNAQVIRIRDGYTIKLPKAMPID